MMNLDDRAAVLRRPRMLLATVVASAILTAAPAVAAATTPELTVQRFYRWLLARSGVALPTVQERAELARFLTAEFIELLAQTSAAEARFIAATPAGDKPPLFEGSLFVGNYEGASEVAYGAVHRAGRTATVDVDLMYIEPRWPKGHKWRAVAWRDRIKLYADREKWAVGDVIMRGRSLSAELRRLHCWLPSKMIAADDAADCLGSGCTGLDATISRPPALPT